MTHTITGSHDITLAITFLDPDYVIDCLIALLAELEKYDSVSQEQTRIIFDTLQPYADHIELLRRLKG